MPKSSASYFNCCLQKGFDPDAAARAGLILRSPSRSLRRDGFRRSFQPLQPRWPFSLATGQESCEEHGCTPSESSENPLSDSQASSASHLVESDTSPSQLKTELEEAAALTSSLLSSCNAVMRAEAQKGRELLKKISACRRSADVQLLDLWELAMQCPETRQALDNTDACAAVIKDAVHSSEAGILSSLFTDIVQLRARTEREVALLEAEASKAAASCAEARAFREEAESQGREHMELLKMRMADAEKIALAAHGSGKRILPENSCNLVQQYQLDCNALPDMQPPNSRRYGSIDLETAVEACLPADSFWLPAASDGELPVNASGQV
eukprot:CAMPEP_0197633318 /NCGR_PEP_ID=MMETSP1338-20131121/9709_1 /TAXON_ID=43686 ORGANISM="Pelagodinium beii, Strain RCC1491" /NCGR_SAMPLE_ID=MMETSP1338 /ASSEMBLY_ACC=CAM_ASM_000754 /LENGTH=325 /DNA_ID=CAMNT_0043204957 /DNA_START=35 /DNA_END=1012 /DNA_ORIENTATION=-